MPAILRRPSGGTVALGLLVLFALLLRLPTAGEQSFWLDEVYSARITDGSLGHAWSTIQRTENTPPLYYLLGWAWVHLFGQGELGLRSLSAVAGALAVVPTVWLARSTGERGTPTRILLLAGLLLAVNPLAQWFSQEARTYGLFVLVAALAWAALAAALARATPGRLWLWALAAVVATWTHYFGGILLLVGGAALVLVAWRGPGFLGLGADPASDDASAAAPRAVAAPGDASVSGATSASDDRPGPQGGPARRPTGVDAIRPLVAPLLASAVGAAAVLPIAVKQQSTSMYEAIAGVKGLGSRIVETPKQFAVGYNAPTEFLLGGVLAVLLAAFVVAGAWPRAGRATRGTGLAAMVVAIWVVPLVALVGGFDVVLTRNWVLLLPPLAVLAAVGAWRLGRRAVVALLAVAVVQLAVVIVVAVNPSYQRDDWRGALEEAVADVAADRPELLSIAHYQPIAGTFYEPRLRFINPAVPVRVRSVALIDRPAEAGDDAPPAVAAPPAPAPGMQLVRAKRNGQYRIFVWRSDQPVTVYPVAIRDLLPGNGLRSSLVLR